VATVNAFVGLVEVDAGEGEEGGSVDIYMQNAAKRQGLVSTLEEPRLMSSIW
jgi:hypothetical protein